MSRMILMALSLLTVIVTNIAASFFTLNHQTTVEIVNRLPVLFNPANYVFIIWIVIFILLFMWIVNFNKITEQMSNKHKNRITFLFVVSCALNTIWLFLWHYSLFNWAVVTELALLGVVLTYYFTFPKKENRLYGRVPFSILTGWVFISSISNISYTLMYHEWEGFGLSDPLWTVFYLTISTAFALHFMYHHRDYVMNLVFVWTFIGIAIRNGIEELFITSAALFLTAVIITCMFLFSGKGVQKK